MPKESLFSTLSAMKPVSLEFRDYLSKELIIQEFKEGTVITHRSEISQIIYFIAYGLVSGSKISNQTKHTYWYAGSGKFIIPDSKKQPNTSVESLEFLSPTLLIGLDINVVTESMTLFKEASHIFLQIWGNRINESTEREIFLRRPFQERFDQFYVGHSGTFGNSHMKNVASYFNTSLRNFERVKNGK